MVPALYSEFRKFMTVRSTYVLSLISLLFAAFISFYGMGYKGGSEFSSDTLETAVLQTIPFVSIFVGVVAILLICHEYRYTTIGYTLTNSNSRLRVMFAKFLVVSAYGFIMAIVTMALVMVLLALGAKLAGHDIGPQSVALYSLVWKSSFFMVSSAVLGMVLGFLSRSLVFALVVYFFLPAIEQIFHNLLKISSNYLPNMVQAQVLQQPSFPGVATEIFSPLASAGMFTAYLAGAILVAAILFVRRDAN